MVVAVKIDSLHRAFREHDFVSGIAGQGDAGNQRMFQPLAKRGTGAMEVSAGVVLLERSLADKYPVNFNGSSGRIIDDFRSFCDGGR
jgi:hypothetical protein